MEYNSLDQSQRNYKKKDAAIVGIAHIAKIMKDSKTYAPHIGPFIKAHIIPEFNCPVAFIRSRTCWSIEYFADFDWTSENGEIMKGVLNGLCQCLRDPAVPVQASAACSLQVLIQAEGVTELLKPSLPMLINQYFRIMDEVESESILGALQAIVEQFGEDIADIAFEMVKQLVVAFRRYSSTAHDDDEAAFSASQCLDIIRAILDTIQERPDIYLPIEFELIPLLHELLAVEERFDHIDGVIEIMQFYTYFPPTISQGMWTLCGPLIHCLNAWAIDYISEIMVPLQNFIAKDTNTFFQTTSSVNNESLVLQVLGIIQKIWIEKNEGGSEAICAGMLLSCLITSSKDYGAMHPVLPQIVSLIFQKLGTVKNDMEGEKLKFKLYELILTLFYYDPMVAINLLSADMQKFQEFMKDFFSCAKNMKAHFTRRIIVISLTALLHIPQDSLPVFLKENSHILFREIIDQCVLIEEEEPDEKDQDEDDPNDEEEEGDDDIEVDSDEEEEGDDTVGSRRKELVKQLDVPDGGYGEDEDCVNAEDEEYRQMLERFKNGDEFDYDDDDDDYEQFQYPTPITSIDMTQFFLDKLNELSSKDQVFVGSLKAGLNQEGVSAFERMIMLQTERKNNK